MERSYRLHKFFFIFLFLILLTASIATPASKALSQAEVWVETDRSTYSIGDAVVVRVQVSFLPATVSIIIDTPVGPYGRDIGSVNPDVWYTVTMTGMTSTSGVYIVQVVADFSGFTDTASTTFTVGGGGVGFDFSISLSPSSLTVEAGQDANFKVLLSYSDPSFSGTVVTIQLTGLGPGMTYQLSGMGDLIIFTTSSTPAGTYPINVIGSANGVIHQTSGILIVQEQAPPFEYSVSISPTSRTLSLGDTGSFTVTVTLTSGDPETVSLSLNGLPGDIQHSFSQASGTPTFTSTLTVDTSGSTSIGTYTFTVNANAAGQVKTATATLTVNEEADFSISVTPPERTLNQGESTTFTVTLNEIGEFNDQVTLIASGLPAGVTPNFGPTSGKPTFTATLNIDTIESTPTGSYTITVDASGGGKTHSITLTLNVEKRPKQSSSLTLSTSSKGGKITVSGSLIPPLEGAEIDVSYQGPDGRTIIHKVIARSDGTFGDIYSPDTSGEWTVTASWAGNEGFEASTSPRTSLTAEKAFDASSILSNPMAIATLLSDPTNLLLIIVAIFAIIALIFAARSRRRGVKRPPRAGNCSKCGAPLKLGYGFCSSCGTRIKRGYDDRGGDIDDYDADDGRYGNGDGNGNGD